MELPWIPILAVLVLGNLIWSWFCCWKARKAYRAAEVLFEWANAMHAPIVCVVNKLKEDGKDCTGGGGPGFPPPPPGSFPPADALE